ncbi:Mycothiol maleylpyruvate isomerase N-terminal domain-containing protein [Asanoa hainanensis]|uniref:Mycothiol maleylpyruvate isomerase N-terminal domain-containing protein n=1 Tax=Asanoa hainanensis TaxID=560556 RepID=A0A239FX21_9ACTN|nr:maleylpyruvate isomerase N-terminal domain-containing protein [Asanoa hainanensis]SNS60763.1 Mycothiol maleylpyruvate isomerase N-terminal domain-containing protein [Asanoa hainanensis]
MHSAAYLDAAAIAVDLLADPAVADRWAEPSALAEFSVGGLAGHLGRQVHMMVELLDAPKTEQRPRDLMAHYGASAWLGKDVDTPANVAIRAQSDEFAAAGHAGVVETLRADLVAIRGTLPAVPGDTSVLLPWTGWALSLDDLLLTRMMEITVHCDDLAVSVELPTPDFPPPVLRPVLGLLTDLAVARHGQVAIVRALSRRERAPETISAL